MTSRGFVFEQKYRGILDDAANNLLDNLKSKKAKNIAELKSVTEHFLEKYFFDKTGRRPMVLPVVIEV